MPAERIFKIPLYRFFHRLRESEFPLGLHDYEKLINILNLKFGIGIPEYGVLLETLNDRGTLNSEREYLSIELLRLCKLLWLKPGQSTQLFEDIFKDTFQFDFENIINQNHRESSLHIPPSENISDLGLNNFKQPFFNNLDSELSTTTAEDANQEDGDVQVKIRVGKQTKENIHFGEGINQELEKSKFLFTQRYFPIDRRKVQQNLRAFQAFRASRTVPQIDIEATIRKTLEKGYFHEIVKKTVRVSTTNILVLIDNGEAMIAFNQLSDLLREEMDRVFNQGEEKPMNALYFHNAASEYFFKNKTHTELIAFEKHVRTLAATNTAIIILSDAGAASGGYQNGTIKAFEKMISCLQKVTRKIVLLNPMPAARWLNSSAGVSKKRVAMFEANETGIKNAIDFLRGNTIKAIKKP
jgi:uncharacterized protein